MTIDQIDPIAVSVDPADDEERAELSLDSEASSKRRREKKVADAAPPPPPLGKAKDRKVTTIDPTLLKPSPTNPRIEVDIDDAEFEESVKKLGILEAITVIPVDGGYQIVSGHRRVAMAIKLGMPSVPILIIDQMEIGERFYREIASNFHQNYNDIERSYALYLSWLIGEVRTHAQEKSVVATSLVELDNPELTMHERIALLTGELLALAECDTMQQYSIGRKTRMSFKDFCADMGIPASRPTISRLLSRISGLSEDEYREIVKARTVSATTVDALLGLPPHRRLPAIQAARERASKSEGKLTENDALRAEVELEAQAEQATQAEQTPSAELSPQAGSVVPVPAPSPLGVPEQPTPAPARAALDVLPMPEDEDEQPGPMPSEPFDATSAASDGWNDDQSEPVSGAMDGTLAGAEKPFVPDPTLALLTKGNTAPAMRTDGPEPQRGSVPPSGHGYASPDQVMMLTAALEAAVTAAEDLRGLPLPSETAAVVSTMLANLERLLRLSGMTE